MGHIRHSLQRCRARDTGGGAGAKDCANLVGICQRHAGGIHPHKDAAPGCLRRGIRHRSAVIHARGCRPRSKVCGGDRALSRADDNVDIRACQDCGLTHPHGGTSGDCQPLHIGHSLDLGEAVHVEGAGAQGSAPHRRPRGGLVALGAGIDPRNPTAGRDAHKPDRNAGHIDVCLQICLIQRLDGDRIAYGDDIAAAAAADLCCDLGFRIDVGVRTAARQGNTNTDAGRHRRSGRRYIHIRIVLRQHIKIGRRYIAAMHRGRYGIGHAVIRQRDGDRDCAGICADCRRQGGRQDFGLDRSTVIGLYRDFAPGAERCVFHPSDHRIVDDIQCVRSGATRPDADTAPHDRHRKGAHKRLNRCIHLGFHGDIGFGCQRRAVTDFGKDAAAVPIADLVFRVGCPG